jgi:undecaprenyl-diphosphatase
MEYWKILILALVQGAAELLPVSSSAHVIVAERLMGLGPARPEMVFLLVMLHTGTMFAVLFYFWPRWRRLGRSRPGAAGGPSAWHFLGMIVLATAVTGVVGYGLKILLESVVLPRVMGKPKAEIEDLFGRLDFIAAALFAVGALILAAGWRPVRTETDAVSPRSAFWVGLVQGLCIPFRGFSRSGATISTALFCGVARPRAEDFSFALAVVLTPPAIGYSLYKLWKKQALPSFAEMADLLRPGLVGMVFSFAAGLVALKFLSAVLEKGRWGYFGLYCLAAAAVVYAMYLRGY